MALTGQLSDMSLAELIEFFCNQRKTGRLKIDYPRGHSVFFIKEGELVDAKVGALSGPEAVYFSLTLPNAAFDFSPDVQATRRTIHGAWTQVVLEGLRRLDEGLSPTEADAFGAWSPSETELAQMFDQVESLDAGKQKQKTPHEKGRAARAARQREESQADDSAGEEASPAPFSMMVEGASGGGGSKKKFVLAGVAAAVVLACAVAAVPLLKSSPAKPAADSSVASAPAAPAQPAEAQPAEVPAESAEAPAADTSAADAAADAARREERERRERERRERERKEDAAAKKDELTGTDAAAKPPAPAAPAGPKSVRVSVTYDEAGRVTQASVAGATAGAEAYGSTAIRIARGRHFPAGKAGSTVITIPVN
jgi:TonB family protein